MSDEAPKKRPISEISHLFLSNVRDMHAQGKPRPRRTPPGEPPTNPAPRHEPIDEVDIPTPIEPSFEADLPEPGSRHVEPHEELTPEEFAEVLGGAEPAAERAADAVGRPHPPVSAVIASHLNGKQFDRVREYARHLTAGGKRVGLIELDGSEFRLMCFETGSPSKWPGQVTDAPLCCEPRQIAEALEEMNWDVDRWLLLLPNPRLPEARALLRQVDHWVLLSTCDHDGVVSSYRTLKGLADAHHPRLSLALLDAAGEADLNRVSRKLAGVCEQFLEVQLECEPAVRRVYRASEHLVVLHRPNRDKSQVANAVQWPIVADFLVRAKAAAERQREQEMQKRVVMERVAAEQQATKELPAPTMTAPAAPQASPATFAAPAAAVQPEAPVMTPIGAPAFAMPTLAAPQVPVAAVDQVIDLPTFDASSETILKAILGGSVADFLECPLRPPMCAEARLAVGRDRGLILFAVARQGLGDLRSIGKAYQWLMENLALIGMAMPQLAIDARQLPRLRLLVDHNDLVADTLRPMLQSEHVTVQGYRKLRWGEKTGLLLEAA